MGAILRMTTALFLLTLVLHSSLFAQDPGPVAHWTFDETTGASTLDSVSGTTDTIQGIYKSVRGVSGNGLRFDGYSTQIVRKGKGAPRLRNAFSVKAWVALDTYPWNWAPVVQQMVDQQAGFFFGVDAFGHLGLRVQVDGAWQSVTSTARLSLKRWAQVVGTYDGSNGLKLYMDGKEVGHLTVQGRMRAADGTESVLSDLLIGRVNKPTLAYPSYSPWIPFLYSLDGILDEISIYDRALTAGEVGRTYTAQKVPDGEVLPWPTLPSGPAGAGRFGAYYTTLKYEEMWDASRRVGPDSDVVVRFDASPMRLVFWQGMNYIPAWVTENGNWYSDQFVEVFGVGCPDGGDCEPISDKQSRYSRVKILESSDARIVVDWRYALAEGVNYKGAWPDPLTGWFDWVDEYWTVYPDGVAVRKQLLWTTNISKGRQFQETLIINSPGTRPEESINLDALIIGNMKGETATYSFWLPKPEGSFERTRDAGRADRPQNPNIQLVNLKSTWKPFQIVSPSHTEVFVNAATSDSGFAFYCFNHWPVAQIASFVRPCVATDRASHTSLSSISWDAYSTTEHTITMLLLNGLTTKLAAELVPLAKSWLSPPELEVVGEGFRGEGYDPAQRAFVVARAGSGKSASCELTLQASPESPVLNPAIVIKNWGEEKARLQINGKVVAWSQDFRRGYIERLEGTDLVVWIRKEATVPLRIGLEPER